MNDINSTDFSGVPALGDAQGLQDYLNNENLKAMGVNPTAAPAVDPNTPPAAPTQVQQQPAAPQGAPIDASQQPNNESGYTKEQIAQLINQVNTIQARLNQPQATPQPVHSPQEREFINQALARGYSLDQITAYLKQRNAQNSVNAAMEQRIAQVERYLQSQEYKQAESSFIDKLSTFGGKWGLSEQDLVTFGNEALKHGINIAVPNVDLETVFRAVYPQQYAIRSQRMTPTSSSQIYGGTSVYEGNRAMAAKQEDAYVDAFLSQAMPSYGKK